MEISLSFTITDNLQNKHTLESNTCRISSLKTLGAMQYHIDLDLSLLNVGLNLCIADKVSNNADI